MRFLIINLSLLLVLTFVGCGYKAGVSTSEQTSYFFFSGDTTNVTVSIDGMATFTVEPGRDNQYKVAPGKHQIRVYRQGLLIVDREVYVGDGIAKEIGVN